MSFIILKKYIITRYTKKLILTLLVSIIQGQGTKSRMKTGSGENGRGGHLPDLAKEPNLEESQEICLSLTAVSLSMYLPVP